MSTGYPILLAHGIARFDALWHPLLAWTHRHISALDRWSDQFQYFRNVASHLRANGFLVEHASVSFAAGVDRRAQELAGEVLRVMSRTGAKKVHIIGHSMGGLDARHMIVDLDMARNVKTLVTIGTPHLGTSFADWGLDRRTAEHQRGNYFIETLKPFLALDGLYDLTRRSCQAFNDRANIREMKNDVRYVAYAATQEREHVFAPLQFSWDIINREEGANDGLVSKTSQLWTEFSEGHDFPFNADHLNECGWWDSNEADRRQEFEASVLDLYLEIARSL